MPNAGLTSNKREFIPLKIILYNTSTVYHISTFIKSYTRKMPSCNADFLLWKQMIVYVSNDIWDVAMKFRNDFIVRILIFLQLTERYRLRGRLFSNHALSSTMLKQLKTFCNAYCEIASSTVVKFFWMSAISWNLRPFKTDFIFANSQKSFGAKSGEWHGCSISVIELWARNYLTAPYELGGPQIHSGHRGKGKSSQLRPGIES
jgi:hypothetical protein